MLSPLDERWRSREKARCKKRKAAAKAKAASRPEPVKLKLDKIEFTSTFTLGGFEPHFLHPRCKTKLEQVAEVLASLKLTIKDLGTHSHANDGTAYVQAKGEVKPVAMTVVSVNEAGNINLNGSSGNFTDPDQAVRYARKYMIELCAHEIDEWLYAAGLGPNPHLWSNGAVPPEEVGKIHEKYRD